MCLTAAGAGLDPDRISFTAALHAVRRTVPLARTRPGAALAETEADILTELVPERRGRVCVRAVTQPSSPFPSRHNVKDPISQHAQHTITINTPARTPSTTTDQARHQPNHANQPP
jgi:hypothetical protein